jgi:hypothetical protein
MQLIFFNYLLRPLKFNAILKSIRIEIYLMFTLRMCSERSELHICGWNIFEIQMNY